jgi:hypothetical protein
MAMPTTTPLSGGSPHEPIRATWREFRTLIAFTVAPFGGAAAFGLLTIGQHWHYSRSMLISIAHRHHVRRL